MSCVPLWAFSLCLWALLVYAYGPSLLCLQALCLCYCFTCCIVDLAHMLSFAIPKYSLTFLCHPELLISGQIALLFARAAPPIVLNHRRERIRLLFLIIIIASAFQIGLRNHWPPPSRLDGMMQLEDNVTALLFLLLFVHPVFVLECFAPVFSRLFVPHRKATRSIAKIPSHI